MFWALSRSPTIAPLPRPTMRSNGRWPLQGKSGRGHKNLHSMPCSNPVFFSNLGLFSRLGWFSHLEHPPEMDNRLRESFLIFKPKNANPSKDCVWINQIWGYCQPQINKVWFTVCVSENDHFFCDNSLPMWAFPHRHLLQHRATNAYPIGATSSPPA